MRVSVDHVKKRLQIASNIYGYIKLVFKKNFYAAVSIGGILTFAVIRLI